MKTLTHPTSHIIAILVMILISFQGMSQPWTPPTGHTDGGQWTFFTAKAQIDNINMVAGDQLAIFDGAKLVGAFTLTQECTEANMYSNQWIAYEKLNEGGSSPVDGYTPGNAYTFKAWKASTNTIYETYNLSWNQLIGNGHEHTHFPATNTYTWDYPELQFYSAPGSLDGYVKKLADNTPIQGATAKIVETGQTVTTDPAGFYQFNVVVAGTYTLAYSATGYGNDTIFNVVVASNGATNLADVLLTTPPGSITGTVSNSDGPIAGATVTTNPGSYTTTTNATGAYTIGNVPPGTYNVTATADYHAASAPASVAVTSNQASTKNFTLTKTQGSLKILVRKATDNSLLEDAEITVNPGGHSATTAATGTAEFNNLSAGAYTISVTHDDYDATSQTAMVSDGYQSTVNVFMISGTITYPASYTNFIGGNPNEPVWTLYIRDITHEGSPLLPNDAIAIYDGTKLVGVGILNQQALPANEFVNFVSVFSQLNDGSDGYQHGNAYTIEVFRFLDGYQYYGSVTLTDPYNNGSYIGTTFPYGDNRYSFVSMELSPGPGTISGHARIAGSSPHSYMEDVLITATETTTAQSYSYTTAADGLYELNGVEPGTYNLTASKYGYTFGSYSNLVVASHATLSGYNFGGTAVATTSQTLSLQTGYQFVSTRIEAADMDMEAVVGGIIGNLTFIKNTAGSFLHKPGPDWVNNIGDWKVKEGYLFNMTAPSVLTLSGIQEAADSPIPVQAGYQLISYLPEYPINAQTALASILDNMEYVRNSAGAYLRKVGGNWVSNIGTMKPGEGYLLKMHAPDVLIYPGASMATLTTEAATAITQTTATTGGNITADGGSAVTARGVVYATTSNPTLGDQVVNSGNGTGAFAANLTGLDPGMTYYVRAFATNAAGTAYGDEVSFDTDPLVANVNLQQSAYVATNSQNATATFGLAPTEGNLLVAITFHRQDGITPTISGSGWELREVILHAVPGDAHGAANTSERRGLAIWTKVAGPAEPNVITTSWTVASENSLIIQEFSGASSYTFDQSVSAKSNGTAVSSLSTGTTAVSASAQSLVITALGTRDDGNDMGVPSWTNNIGDNINASGNIRGLHAAFGMHTTQGAKESTATWTNSKQASAAIVVFSVTP
jgi:hypothetical protein